MDELFQTIPNILGEFDDHPEMREAFIFAAWRKAAGEQLSNNTVPVRLTEKRLVVAVADKMWKRHLELLSDQMIFKLNSILKDEVVKFIDFRIDEKTVNKEKAAHEQTVDDKKTASLAAMNKITPALQKSASAIEDEHLRQIFLLAAGSCLARKERLEKSGK